MMKHLKSVISLTLISAVAAVLLATTNYFTAPIIEKNEAAAANEALLVVMPEGKGFEQIDISAYTLPATVTEAYAEESGGVVVKLVTAGYSTGLTIMCGIDSDGNITGAVCLGSSETLGYEKEYGKNAIGMNANTIENLDTIAGATKTTGGYKNALKDALNSFVILNGGTVDIRTEEEILADNLNNALPAGNGEFEEIFITEVLEGIDSVYSAKNGNGYVYVLGEAFVGVDSNGSVAGDADEAAKALVSAAHEVMLNSKLAEIDISSYDLESNVLKVSKTESGNYLFELRAAGFGINGDKWYNPSGEYIYITLSATSDGKIISIKTTEQSETEGIGSVCADKSFYGQFVGKDETNYKEIDAIAGATYTTSGYKTAVGRALEAIKILEGATSNEK